MKEDLISLTTEQINEQSRNIDKQSTYDILKIMNNEDHKVAQAVQNCLQPISEAVDQIHHSIRHGGRLIYVGAGTSGRLGILDAAECPPTFGTPHEMVQAIMAGGSKAILQAVEGAEDSSEHGRLDLIEKELQAGDTVVGITASGRTPYVVGALQYAKEVGAATVGIACNSNSRVGQVADIAIEVEVGPEVIMGSTRLKAATAQKMVLNMLSTATMVKLGKVYQNLMIDLAPTNVKLIDRARRIVANVTNSSYEKAQQVLDLADQEVKTAIVMIEGDATANEARRSIEEAGGMVRAAIGHVLKVKEGDAG
ncbi:N-acetylmuramic acid 6-phosphate etherase [Bacillus horti]|uniref:N-acetylmuramic acid 6-phosphate etherase n=1 Tax=Caldalkalibacillus horti TaxID=77523 RepID=A0ABT9VZM9_9BACI|nr:N-acetylmuramic acid 6-phosphate etherase [Bacillus horti]